MKVKIVNPDNATGLIDPVTKRSPFVDPETGAVIGDAEVPETSFWIRRVIAGEIERIDVPNGNAPVAPLINRGPR